MKFYDRINDLNKRPGLFGVLSSEDIFWIILGYCIAEQKKIGKNMSLELGCRMIEYFQRNFMVNNENINWGVTMRSYSLNDKHSLCIFKKVFDGAKLENLSLIAECSKSFKEFIEDSPNSHIVKILSYLRQKDIVDNVVDVDKFLCGYLWACDDFEIIDDINDWYNKKRISVSHEILKEYNLPEYSNYINAIYSKFYLNPLNGIDFFVDRFFSI